MTTEFAQLLLAWYDKNARSLPWRGQSDPYKVWVSEIMLQQTRVETVSPYYHRWINRFPDLTTLAEADEIEILRIWEGLGYYSRARNLHQAAKKIFSEFNGQIPDNLDQLQKLPGIGSYTAAAIASIAFGKDEAVVDGNVKRVLARVFNYALPINTSLAEKELGQLAYSLLPAGKAGDYNQAVMDLGATICAPRSPACGCCPLRIICETNRLNLQMVLPAKNKPAPIPHLIVTAGILHRDNKVLLAQRPRQGLLGGLWEFPGGKVEPEESLKQALQRELAEELGIHTDIGKKTGEYNHAYTHFRVTLHAFHIENIVGEPRAIQPREIRWVNIADLEEYPMGKIDRMISRDLKGTRHG